MACSTVVCVCWGPPVCTVRILQMIQSVCACHCALYRVPRPCFVPLRLPAYQPSTRGGGGGDQPSPRFDWWGFRVWLLDPGQGFQATPRPCTAQCWQGRRTIEPLPCEAGWKASALCAPEPLPSCASRCCSVLCWRFGGASHHPCFSVFSLPSSAAMPWG